jgi:FMN-dependent NADH-azoreductase
VNLLQINTSPRAADSMSTKFANQIVDKLKAQHTNVNHEVLDLGKTPHAILDEMAIGSLFTPADARSEAQNARVAIDDGLIVQAQWADTIVIGVPMYNFAIPVQLKAWLDAIARAGVTFRYTDQGPEGLLTGKKVYLALARGGIYRGTPNDTQVPYLNMILGFLGMTDLNYVYAEGFALGSEAAAKAIADAESQIQALFA